MKQCFSLFLLMVAVMISAKEFTAQRFDFSSGEHLKRQWMHKGKQFGIPHTEFYIADSSAAVDGKVLVVKTKSSSGVLITRITDNVWQKYPIMRWRWRILKKVRFSGREPDDQAAVIYFGDGSMLKQFMVAYRWENTFPQGNEGLIKYGMGSTLVHHICMQNKNAETGKWYEEERNVVEDFKRVFGRVPEGDCGLTVGGNSQYSKSETVVEIDFIEFRSNKKNVPIEVKTAERKNNR